MENNSVNVNNSKESSSEPAMPDPIFIRRMLALPKQNNRVFLVGNPTLEQRLEEIAVCKELLMAHSETFQLMLEDSSLAEKGVVKIPDIQPNTFKHFLRFVYGYNSFSTLPLDEVLDLLYVAEKYMVEELKTKLITYISPLLSIDNVCSVLQRPECLMQKVLKDVISEIVQKDTDILLSQDVFLDLNTFEIVAILEQDALAVPEIELWRAVLRWANHNENKVGTSVQQLMREGPLENLRLCTLDIRDFCKEVSPTKILTDQEIVLIMQSISTNKVIESLKTVCNTIDIRDFRSKLLATSFNISEPFRTKLDTTLSITTHNFHMLLISALFESCEHSIYHTDIPKCLRLQYVCTVTVTRVNNYITCSEVPDLPVKFVLENYVDYGKEFEMSFTSSGHCLKLLSCSKYKLSFEFESMKYSSIKFYSITNCSNITKKNYIYTNTELDNKYGTIIKKLTYKLV